jgi:hypothetical protein
MSIHFRLILVAVGLAFFSPNALAETEVSPEARELIRRVEALISYSTGYDRLRPSTQNRKARVLRGLVQQTEILSKELRYGAQARLPKEHREDAGIEFAKLKLADSLGMLALEWNVLAGHESDKGFMREAVNHLSVLSTSLRARNPAKKRMLRELKARSALTLNSYLLTQIGELSYQLSPLPTAPLGRRSMQARERAGQVLRRPRWMRHFTRPKLALHR